MSGGILNDRDQPQEHDRTGDSAQTDENTVQTTSSCITTASHFGEEGYLALRGLTEPAPYLASGHFL